MAKKPTSAPAPKVVSKSPAPAAKAASPAPVSTAVRNSAVPPKPAAAATPKPAPTYEAISQRAYEIWQSGSGGSEHDNWCRAERELRGG